RPEQEPWDDHLRRAGLDPDDVEVVPPVEIRTWDAADGAGGVRTMVYFKAKIVARSARTDVAELVKWVLRQKPRKRNLESARDNPSSLVVAWADPQIGKPDGDGTKGTVERWMNSHSQVLDRWCDLKKTGVNLDRIVVASL